MILILTDSKWIIGMVKSDFIIHIYYNNFNVRIWRTASSQLHERNKINR